MTYQVQATIPYFTGIPKDVVTNTWYFDWLGIGSPSGTDYNNCIDNLASVYDAVYNSAGAKWAPWCKPALARVKMYDLSDTTPRVPVVDAAFSLSQTTLGSGVFIPPEVAVVASYHTEFESGVNKASQRGRVYFGCCTENWFNAGGATTFPVVASTQRSAVTGALVDLAADSLANDWGWVVYSRKLNDSFAVAGGWVDDAFDTQRRRGNAPLVRTTFST